ncbi:hypothetical protein EJ02DRAFT_222366 [Clathrospora elynae]|uniref:Uncharacterized protein n=1 Tax=Clathrospora elynae TaxID=706981 RepID=A0A6A5SUS1_9PLEO|nr:hypothetical protein EJ02DRAFT_222366 [Clathrospora elynae]
MHWTAIFDTTRCCAWYKRGFSKGLLSEASVLNCHGSLFSYSVQHLSSKRASAKLLQGLFLQLLAFLKPCRETLLSLYILVVFTAGVDILYSGLFVGEIDRETAEGKVVDFVAKFLRKLKDRRSFQRRDFLVVYEDWPGFDSNAEVG